MALSLFVYFFIERAHYHAVVARGDIAPAWLDQALYPFDFFAWDEANAGSPSLNPAYVLHGFLWQIGYQLGLQTSTIQSIQDAAIHATSALAIYYLASRLFPCRPVLYFASSIFYTINFDWIINSSISVTLLRPLIPLLIALYIDFQLCISNKKYFKAAVLALFFSLSIGLFGSYAISNFPQFLIAMLGVALFILFVLLQQPSISLIISTVVLVIISIAINFWLIAILASYFVFGLKSPEAGVAAIIDPLSWSWTHVRNSFLNIFQLNPIWSWRQEYFAFFDLYKHPLFCFGTFLPTILAISAALFSRRREAALVTGVTLGLIFLVFLGKGLHDPFAQINLWLYRHIPGLWLLREPYSKLSPLLMLLYAILIGYSIDSLYRMVLRSTPAAVRFGAIVGLIACVVSTSAPLLNGSILYGATENITSGYVRIPEYWYAVVQVVRPPTGEERILILPGNDFYLVPYTWGMYAIDFLPTRLMSPATLNHTYSYISFNKSYEKIVNWLYQRLEQNEWIGKGNQFDISSDEIMRILKLLSVRFVVVRNDIGDRKVLPLGGGTPDHRLSAIHRNIDALGLAKVARIGALDIYEIPEQYITKRVYGSGTVRAWDWPLPPEGMNVLDESASRIVFLQDSELSKSSGVLVAPGEVTYTQLAPSAYFVHIRGATGPFWLVLQTSYHPFWRARILEFNWCSSDQRLSEKLSPSASRPIGCASFDRGMPSLLEHFGFLLKTWWTPTVPNERHVLANGYANAWLIDQHGDYDILLEYWPQRLVVLGMGVSVLSTACMLLVLLLIWVSRCTADRAVRR